MSFRLAFILLPLAGGLVPWATAQDVMVSAAQVQGLPVGTAALGRTVRLEGVMTFIDAAAGRAFVQDESGGIALKLTPQAVLPAGLRPGSRVIVEGVTAVGQFLPWVEGPGGAAPSIQVIGEGALPVAKPVNSPQLTLPDMDSQWIEIWGVVRPPQAPYQGAVVALEAEGRTFFVYLPEGASPRQLSPSLLGIRVRIRAVAGTFVNERRQMTRRVLFIPSIESITTEKALILDDPFQRPQVAFDELLRAHTKGAIERAKVSGTVTLALPNQGLYIREANGGGLWVQTSQGFAGPLVKAGDVVEAVGWPEASDFRPEMRGAVFRVVSHGTPVLPISATAQELLSSRHHADLVVVEGSVVGHVDEPLGTRLLLSHDDGFFEARIPHSVAKEPLPEWVRDARLKITGICENVPGEGVSSLQISPMFFIRVSAMRDVVVISSPPWWSARRMLWLLGVAVGCAMLVGIWAVALRRRVAIQTRVIEAQVHRAGAHEERQRLARELHDSLEQEMTGVGLQLETALARLATEPDAAKLSVERARRLLHRAQRETRETIWDLRSSPNDPSVLPGLLRELLGPLVDAAGSTLQVTCSENLPEGMQNSLMHHLVRVAQEAVANSTKHGQSRTIRVSVDFVNDEIRLRVADDGCGFQQDGVPGARQGHFGLTGMQERAAKCDGTLTISSTPGHGTEVLFTAPIPPRNQSLHENSHSSQTSHSPR